MCVIICARYYVMHSYRVTTLVRGPLYRAWTSTVNAGEWEPILINLKSVRDGIPRPIHGLILGSKVVPDRLNNVLFGGILPFRFFRSHQTPSKSVGGICNVLIVLNYHIQLLV